ncbi:hypothetical protein D3C72_1743890 [compost metagenome]
MHQGADAFHRTAFAGADFRGVDERRAVQADVDERRLHPRQHPYHLALVDVADYAAALRALDMHLLQHTVLDYRHARLHRRDIDQNLFAHAVDLSQVLPTRNAESGEQLRRFQQRQSHYR